MRYPAWVADALVRCVREHPWREPAPGLGDAIEGRDVQTLALAAIEHRVAGCVWHSLRSESREPGPDLGDAYRASVATHVQIVAGLAAVAPILDRCGVPWLVVKGPVLAEVFYAFPDLRTYQDLDILIPQAAFREVALRLESEGFPIVDKDWAVARRELAGEVNLALPRGLYVDLHWHLHYHAALRGRFRIEIDPLFRDARDVVVGGVRTQTTSAADTVVHLAVHACRVGGGRLQWLKDIERAAAAPDVDWDAVVARSRAWSVGPPVGVMLRRAKAFLGAPVPDDTLRALDSWVWTRTVGLIDQWAPPTRTAGRASLSTTMAQASSRTSRASFAELCRLAATGVRRSTPQGLAQHDGSSGAVTRDDYFAAIGESGGRG